MLLPDVNQTENTIQLSMQAESPVTIYASAMRFVVGPMLGGFPKWFTSIGSDIHEAVTHAETWQDTLCIDITSAVPHSIISYNETFQVKSDQLVNLISEIELGGGRATPAQQQQAAGYFGDLSAKLSSEQQTLGALNTQLVTLMGDLQGDHTHLVDAEQTIKSKILSGSEIIEKLEADLGDDFLDTTVQGPCNVTVSLDFTVDLKIKEAAGENTELLPYAIAKKLLENAADDNEKATQALSSVLTLWQTLQGKMDEVSGRVKAASRKDVAPILKELDIQAAQNGWNDLQTFAQSLENGS